MTKPVTAETSDSSKNSTELLDKRIRGITAWLKENCPECVLDQAHLDNGSVERAYWHYGYLVALKDMRKLLERTIRSAN